ncbi:hypothetical protein HMPREF9140_01842 [Prevotella micans F0438]|uniref:Uncharacterized protein n=1 Tax=Prevotella micans F0438 TaxID=883158 RepID=H1Q4K4_9BACT|nr:fimbrillin family protein [Prevotella micans]EHO67105.1 hypothetical protein HMPREF9140_01842 [Prevotella micans F0438]
MKKTIFILIAGLTIGFSSCGNEPVDNPKHDNKSVGLNFDIVEEEFDSIDWNKTRTLSKPVSHEYVDLGNGIEGEVQIFEAGSHPKPRTRAIVNKHYSIRAYQGGVLKGSMKGTFNGSTFTPDASSATKMILEPGTYDFVCYNDKFQEVGNNLELNVNDAKDAFFGQTSQSIYGTQSKVAFQMRHACSRLSIQLQTYGKLLPGATASIYPVNSNGPTKLVYVASTNSFSQTSGTISPSTISYSGAEITGSNMQGWATPDKYIYYTPGVDISNLRMKFTSGTFGDGRNLSDAKPIGFKSGDPSYGNIMGLNKNYQMTILLWAKLKYLFSDGTSGYLTDNPTKSRIGLVIRDKTASSKGLAMALQNTTKYNNNEYPDQNPPGGKYNSTTYSTVASLVNDMDGEKWTWEPSGNTDGIFRANDQTNFNIYYEAAHYNPGVPVASNIRWFLPSAGQWIEAYTVMSKQCGYPIDWSGITNWGTRITFSMAIHQYFTRYFPINTYNAIGRMIFGNYATSTQYAPGIYATLEIEPYDRNRLTFKSYYWPAYAAIRPFTHF